MKATDVACPNCGLNDHNAFSEDWGHRENAFVVEIDKETGIKPSVNDAVLQQLPEGKRGLWRKIASLMQKDPGIIEFDGVILIIPPTTMYVRQQSINSKYGVFMLLKHMTCTYYSPDARNSTSRCAPEFI